MNRSLLRARWAAFGAAVVVSLGGGAMWIADAAPADDGVEFVAITPCRLFATRPAPSTVGARALPIGARETFTAAVWGTNGNCTVPVTATSVVMNVTVLAGTATSNLTVFPADAVKPNTSNLNWRAGDGATPNAVTVGLSATGSVSFFNAAGTVQVIADIVGYYKIEPTPAQVVTVAKSGGDFTSVASAMASITDASSVKPYVIEIAPGVYSEAAGVDVKPFVTVNGAGIEATTITCTCDAAVDPVAGAAAGAGAVFRVQGTTTEATISNLTVENTGAGAWSNGIDVVNVSGGQVVLRDVALAASGGTVVSAGVYASASRVTLDRVVTVGTANGGVAGSVGAGLFMTNGSVVLTYDSIMRGGAGSLRTVGAHIQGATGIFEDSKIYAVVSGSYGIYQLPIANGDTNTYVTQSDVSGVAAAMSVAANSSIRFNVGTITGSVVGAGTKNCGGIVNTQTFTMLTTSCG